MVVLHQAVISYALLTCGCYLQLSRPCLVLFAQLLLFEVAEHRRTLIVYPDCCGKTRLDLLVAQLVQFFFEKIRLLGHFDALEAAAQGGDADKYDMRLAHLLLTRCFLMSHSFLSVPDTLCSFSIRDFVDHCRFSQR